MSDDQKHEEAAVPLSPGAGKRLQHDLEVEDRRLAAELNREQLEAENLYRSCCGCRLDRRAALYFTQLCISIFVLAFSCYQLRYGGDERCETSQLYVGLLTLILGWWAPAPSLR